MVFGIVPKLQQMVMQLPIGNTAKAFLSHPAGPFTVFFWAPTVKWLITFANIKDLEIPAENISTPQQSVIFTTGAIWARYSVVITPINYNLMTVNMAMCLTGAYQLYRKAKLPKEKGGLFG